MNREDIIKLARQAGLSFNQSLEELSTPFCDGVHCENLERFAALVTEAEREACAKLCEAQEDDGGEWDIQQQCANSIRARGNK